MTSTGNDIVSLNAINITRTKEARFYSKILSPTEKALYSQAFAAIPFENFVWLLWSIKESAYKFLKRNNPDLVFTPIKFVVKRLFIPTGYTLTNFDGPVSEGAGFNHLAAFEAVIRVGNNVLYSKTLMFRELVVSVVNNKVDFENICWGLKLIEKDHPEYQSAAVRTFLIDRLQSHLNLDDLVINKNQEQIPFVLKQTRVLPIPVSLSHHDCFVGYSFQLADLPELIV